MIRNLTVWRRHPLVILVTLVTLGSGLLNISSVIGPTLPERRAILREIFPLEFQHLSRSLTLLIGFALIISSINIYRRKKRAFQIVSALMAFSIFFHFTKGLDYEEATLSAVLLALLLAARKEFTVRSSIPDWRSGLARLGIAFSVALAYGVAGFWFLEPREFGLNFTLGDSIRRTLLFLALAGDPTIHPHTRYAHWFVDSLYVATITAILFGGFALFRPALYAFRQHPHEMALAKAIVGRYGRSALDFFKTWPDKSFFFTPDQQCFLAYGVANNFAVVLGDPVGPGPRIEEIIRGFALHCQENDWGLAFHQTLPDFLPVYRRLGFKKLKLGDDAIVNLDSFSLEGKAVKPVRNALTKLEKTGIQVSYYAPPVPEEVLTQAREVSDEWLTIPGRRERRFSLGMFEHGYLRSTPLLAACDKHGRMLAFLNIVPSPAQGEAAADLMRRRNDAPNGVMDYLFVKAFLLGRQQGHSRFNLGMAPMSGFQEKEEATPQERAVHTFFQQLNFLFSYKGLRAYKAKFASHWEPRYVVYRNVLDLPRAALALSKISELD